MLPRVVAGPSCHDRVCQAAATEAALASLRSAATTPRTGGDIMATTNNKQLMQHIFTEAAQGNLEPFLEHMAEDMRWTVIGTTKFSGTLTGKQEVLDKRLTPLATQLDGPIRVTAHHVIAEGDYVVVEGRGQAMTKTGKPYNK